MGAILLRCLATGGPRKLSTLPRPSEITSSCYVDKTDTREGLRRRKKPCVLVLDSVPKGGDRHRIGYEPQTLSERPHRRTVGRPGAADSPGPAGRTAAPDRHARGRQRPLLPHPRGRRLAGTAPRLPALEDGLQLLPVVDLGRHLAEDPRRPPPPGALQ